MDRLVLLSLATFLVADQLLKRSVLAGLGVSGVIELGRWARIRPAVNRRTLARRFGIGPIQLSIAWVACLLSTRLVLAPRSGGIGALVANAGLGAALGGAAGNLLDVIRRKGVLDYVEVRPWPAFNLADVAIVSGVIVALVAR